MRVLCFGFRLGFRVPRKEGFGFWVPARVSFYCKGSKVRIRFVFSIWILNVGVIYDEGCAGIFLCRFRANDTSLFFWIRVLSLSWRRIMI